MKTVKFKHNKKRNSAFLYEVLIKELTNSILNKEQEKTLEIKNILKEYFKKGTHLKNDLDSYRALYESSSVSHGIAEKLLNKSLESRVKINEKDLFIEQTRLIKTINSKLGGGIYNNFTPNYRNLATIFQFFNKTTSVKDKVLLENKILNTMCLKNGERGGLKPVDSLSYSIFIKKFNSKYGDALLEGQKKLLNLFLGDEVGNFTDLKIFLNNEIPSLLERIEKIYLKEEDEGTKKNYKLVKETLNGFVNKEISHNMLKKILNIQGLIHEAKSNEN